VRDGQPLATDDAEQDERWGSSYVRGAGQPSIGGMSIAQRRPSHACATVAWIASTCALTASRHAMASPNSDLLTAW
jgi:hypothetical protein